MMRKRNTSNEAAADKTANCFAHFLSGSSILTKYNCAGCSFYKSREEFEKSAKNSYDRLISLSKEEQIYIADKYYKIKDAEQYIERQWK